MLGPDPRCLPQVDQLTKTVGARTLLNLASGTATTTAAASGARSARRGTSAIAHIRADPDKLEITQVNQLLGHGLVRPAPADPTPTRLGPVLIAWLESRATLRTSPEQAEFQNAHRCVPF